MPIEAAYLNSDVEAVETEEVNLGSVVGVTLPDGVMIVTGIQSGAQAALSMEDAGYGDKRTNEVSIRMSEFERVGAASIPTAKQELFVKPKNVTGDDYEAGSMWTIENVSKPDSTLYLFRLVQSV